MVDAGAIIVGKTKTWQFASGAYWQDYSEPFNPRGDGYQSPSGSSSGSGAAIASYPWLDLTLGSDTGGSIRGPAVAAGLYSNRPTHGLVALEGTTPFAPTLDTAGLLARDPLLWAEAAQAMYLDNVTLSHAYPRKIKLYDFPEKPIFPADHILLDFASKVSKFLGAETKKFYVLQRWRESHPVDAPGNLNTLLYVSQTLTK